MPEFLHKCRHCGKPMPPSVFRRCKACLKQVSDWREKNIDRVNAWRRLNRSKHTKREKELRRRYYLLHKEHAKNYSHHYYLKHKTKCLSQNKTWVKSNRLKKRTLNHQSRKKHWDRFLEYQKQLQKKWRVTLEKSYVLSVLVKRSNIDRKSIPDSLIELKAAQLKLKRLCLKYKQTNS